MSQNANSGTRSPSTATNAAAPADASCSTASGWRRPSVREIPCGYEINAYASAERRARS